MPYILRPMIEIVALLSASGMSVEDLSRQTGIPKTRIHGATLGRDNLSIDNLHACKAVLTRALTLKTAAPASAPIAQADSQAPSPTVAQTTANDKAAA